jgi:hypothetical protein
MENLMVWLVGNNNFGATGLVEISVETQEPSNMFDRIN